MNRNAERLAERLAVCGSTAELQGSAQSLAEELDLPWTESADADNHEALLLVTARGLQLQLCGPQAPGPITVDFGAGQMRHRRRGGHNELLGRAVGIGKWPQLSVLDATAGLGRDSFVLADLGCRVTLCERSTLAYALLRDGLERARTSADAWLQEVSGRMQLQLSDGVDCMRQWSGEAPHTVYLDPMFPPRKKSARVKKEMWLFQYLLDTEDTGEELLEPALALARHRVVVKRSNRAAALGGHKPHFELGGKTVRFDVYNCA